MIIDLLRLEHRNIEKLLLVLEQELSVFDRGERPDYEVIWANWAEIASSRSASQPDPLFSAAAEERFKAVRRHILQLEQDAEAERTRRKERKREEMTA